MLKLAYWLIIYGKSDNSNNYEFIHTGYKWENKYDQFGWFEWVKHNKAISYFMAWMNIIGKTVAIMDMDQEYGNSTWNKHSCVHIFIGMEINI